MIRVLLFLILGAVFIPCPAAGKDGDVPYEQYARELLSRLELEGLLRKPEALRVVLEEGYLSMRLGAFDVWYPRSAMPDTQGFKDFKAVLKALVDLQGRWIEWFTEGRDVPRCKRERALLKKWTRRLRAGKCIHAGPSDYGPPEITILLDAPEKVREAATAFCDYMTRLDYLEASKRAAEPIKFVFYPNRREYLLLGSFLSTLSKDHELFFHVPGFPYWTSYSYGDIVYIALEKAKGGPGQGDFIEGERLDMRSRTGMLQHVVYHVMGHLITAVFGRRLHKNLADGLAMNMVIELYEENNVEVGGGRNTRGGTPPSRFYLGTTNPSRARVESLWCETRWRKNKGSDYFLRPLQYAQDKGAKAARKTIHKPDRPNAFFLLQPDDAKAGSHLISSPFLDGFGKKKKIPRRFTNDYLEFHRAYRSAITYWLKHHAESEADDSEPELLFRKLLLQTAAISSISVQSDFNEIVTDIYGKPLCAGDGVADSLENDFLDWLAGR